jgi:YD repeat-containing protein
MKKLFQWVMVATLICGASVLTACSDNSDNPVNPDPSEKAMPRVSKIYMEGHIVLKRKVMGNWMTLTDKTDERALEHEFYWTGNRLDSAKDVVTDTTWEMEYDEQGRLVHEYTRLGSFDCTYEYDNKGRLSKTPRYCNEKYMSRDCRGKEADSLRCPPDSRWGKYAADGDGRNVECQGISPTNGKGRSLKEKRKFRLRQNHTETQSLTASSV